jgi:hypothetical protein
MQGYVRQWRALLSVRYQGGFEQMAQPQPEDSAQCRCSLLRVTLSLPDSTRAYLASVFLLSLTHTSAIQR